jgi:hypothetical protein
MSEPEEFIARWSRRKAAATEGHVAQTEAPVDEPVAGDEEKSAAPPEPAQSEPAAPAIDPATLPPIETIEAGTDISVFLRTGVPADITRAALRRAWAADPAIRDFIGLSENAWDFTAPDGVPGFGPLSAADASRLMAEFAGKAKEVVAQLDTFEIPAEPAQAAASPGQSVAPPISANEEDKKRVGSEPDQPAAESYAIVGSSSVQCDKENDATQHDRIEAIDRSHPARRTHGSALPE